MQIPDTTQKAVLLKDKKLAAIVEDITLEALSLSTDIYGRLSRAIVYQQLSGKAASTIYSRFLALFPQHTYNYDQVLNCSIDELRSAGLSRQKATYVQNVAHFFKEHQLQAYNWDAASEQEILELLTQIKGVGQWTVEMILIFSLGRSDVFPTADLSIQQAMQQLYGLNSKGKTLVKEMESIAKQWQPYRSLACRYLWAWIDMGKGK